MKSSDARSTGDGIKTSNMEALKLDGVATVPSVLQKNYEKQIFYIFIIFVPSKKKKLK